MSHFDVMISYQWATQANCIKIKKNLEKCGYSVWIDVEQMHGSMNQRMAEAIENCQCVLLCVTGQYNISTNCQKVKELSLTCFCVYHLHKIIFIFKQGS